MLTCFFIGHHNASESMRPFLDEAVERHIMDYNVTCFTVGRYGNFDRMAAGAVKAAKKRHPEVTLSLLLPYHPYDQPIDVPDGFDHTFYPPGMETVPKRVAILRVNQYMIQHCDYLIVYDLEYGNTGNIMEAARRRARKGLIHIENLAEQMPEYR